MSNSLKAAIVSVLSALVILIGIVIQELSPTPSVPEPPVVTPPPVTSTVQVLDSFERPEFATADLWKHYVSRTILSGAVTGFVVKTPTPCTFAVGVSGGGNVEAILKMVKTTVTVPSYEGGRAGDYYDALVPLNAANCATAEYLWVDVTRGSYSFGDATVVVLSKNTLPAVPTKPMMMLMANSFLTSGHYGRYENGSEALGIPYLQAMIAHRLHPYNSLVTVPTVSSGFLNLDGGGAISYRNNVLNFSPTFSFFPNFSTDAAYSATQATVTRDSIRNPWFYTMDEPQDSQLPGLRTLLAKQKLLAPSVKRMVTTPVRADLDANIFCPVAEHFEEGTFPKEAAYAGKDLWVYVSCMSHGCSTDLAGNLAATKFSGNQTGAPDLTLDRSSAEPFGFALLARRYPSVKALLYYNTVEQYKLYPRGVDMWTGGLFNFGGNLDGTLFWPGRPGIEGLTSHVPVVSVRMKLLREAQNLSDALSLVPDQAWVATRAAQIMTSPLRWTRDVKVFEQLQREAMERL